MRTMPETAAITARITSPSCAIWPLISFPRNPPKTPCASKLNGPAGRTPTSQNSSPKSEMRLPWSLDRHEVGAVAGQGHEVDVQRFGHLTHHAGAMIGGAIPDDDQLVFGPFSPEPAQDINGVLAVGAGIGPEPHRAFVVEIEAVEGQLVRQTRRGRGDPEAPAALRPAIAEIGILVDVRFVQVDQQMAVALGTGEE